MKKLFAASLLLAASYAPTPALAWALIPGLAQPVTVVAHFVFGYFTAAYMDKHGLSEYSEATTAALGIAKELSDIHFSVSDAIAWPIGAYAYRLGKEHPEWCQPMTEYEAQYWYIPQRPCPLDTK